MSRLYPSKCWKMEPPDPERQAVLSEGLGVSPVLAQLLINRGVTDLDEARRFLSVSLSGLYDPLLLTDMDKAVARIREARHKGERVLIYGDYDVDGITSIALLQKALERAGLDVAHHIPHRIHDGYGLNKNVAKIAKEHGAGLFISVDCGITACHEVEILNKAGIDVIVIDHHEPGPSGLPPAVAVVDPKRRDCRYPFKDLAAVGLVMKLIQAIEEEINGNILDLVTLGTIADVVTLTGENRIIVRNGLGKIRDTKNIGLAALMDVTKIRGKKIRPHSIGFILGPRLNATGRMDSAHRSLALLLSEDVQEACQLALALDHFNTRRQKIQRAMIDDAIELVEREVNFKDQKVIVVGKPGWHQGVLGIVAARVAEKYSRPAIVISLDKGIGRASARSVAGFHLTEALTHCSEFLEEYGGHRLAAGLTIREENIARFRDMINDFAGRLMPFADLLPSLTVDGELPLSAVRDALLDELALLEPHGEGNPMPVFCTRNLTVKGRPSLRARDTIKFWVTDGNVTLPVVGFGLGRIREFLSPGRRVDCVYQLTVDEWQGISTIQLKLVDIRTSES